MAEGLPWSNWKLATYQAEECPHWQLQWLLALSNFGQSPRDHHGGWVLQGMLQVLPSLKDPRAAHLGQVLSSLKNPRAAHPGPLQPLDPWKVQQDRPRALYFLQLALPPLALRL
jgi:hypothetical protein